MASITLYPTSNGSVSHSISGGGTAYGALADNSDSTYIYHKASKDQEVVTSTFNVGTSSAISGRYVINSIVAVSRTKKGYSLMNTASAHSNLYVGGIEGASWGLDVSTSWTNRSHTTDMSKYTNINGKAITSLPSLVLHLQSTTEVGTTGDNKYVGFSRAYLTIDYDNLYSQSAQGSTGVSASLSNSGSAVEGYYRSGTTTTYTATLSNGYGFDGWYTAATGGTRVSRNLSYSETCNSNRTLYARAFAVSVQGETGVTASMSRGSDGYTFTFTASMASDQKYGFKGWYTNSTGSGSAASTSLSYTVALSSATTYYARVFIVTAQGETGVSAAVSRGSDGRTFTFTGTLVAGSSTSKYGFKGWYSADTGGSLLSTNISYSVTLSSDTTYYAKVFTVTASGSTGVSASLTRSSDGRTFTFTASLSNNYAIDGWYDGSTKVSGDLSYTSTLSDSTALTARAFSVSYSGDSHITVSATRASDGKSYTFTGTLSTTTSDTAYTLNQWTVNSSPLSTSDLSIDVQITADTTVTASSFATTVAKDSGFSAASISRASSTSVTVSATLKDDYALDGWYNGNTRESRSLSYTKTISADTELTAKSFSVSYSGDSGISVTAVRSSDGRNYTFTGTLVTNATSASVFKEWTFGGATVTGASTLTYTKTIEEDSVIGASSYTITVAKGTGAESVSISRNSITSLTISCSMSVGYDFDGWYVNNTKRSSASQTTLSSINASETYTANGVLHVYSLNIIGDQHSTGSIAADNYYYGTVATFTASVANKYLFDGFYNDQAFTSLYSSSNPATYTITGDKTLYIKTRPRKRIFNKVNGEWKIVDNVYVKINGAWVLLDQDELPFAFSSDVKYILKSQS